MIDLNYAAQVYPCEHGDPYCIYHDHDDELCEKCLKDRIAFYRKELQRIKHGTSR